MKISRSVFAYKAKLKDDSMISYQLKQLSIKHKRYGFRKLFCLIRRKGFTWNHKRVYHVYRLLNLNLKCKPKKRLPSRKKIHLQEPRSINQTWSLDYMSDVLTNGNRFRTANIIDDCKRESLGIKASRSLSAKQVIEFLDDIARSRGYPRKLRVDNGPENISKTMQLWANNHRVKLAHIQPGKPAQNGYIERFNRTYREEVLDMHLFRSIEEVQAITDQWVYEYNNERPHYSLGNLTPIEYAKQKILF